MRKCIYTIVVLTALPLFSAHGIADTIMLGETNSSISTVFPDLADYSQLEKSAEAADSPDIQLQPAILPFSGKKDRSSNYTKPKSTRKAFFLSLIIPGLGEVYVGSKRAVVFLGIEALSWWMYLKNTNEGEDLEDEYQRFADMNWHYYDTTNSAGDTLKCNYWGWLQHTYSINPDEIAPEDYDMITDILKKDKDNPSAHSLPSTENQQYYEMIGKYDHFIYGWEDLNPDNGYNDDIRNKTTPLRSEYNNMRADSNDKLNAGQRGIHIMIINRVLSAIDAGRCAYRYNKKLDSDLSMVRVRLVQKHIIDNKVLMLMVTKKF